MNDFIVFKTYKGKMAIRKSTILSIYEDEDYGNITHVVTDESNFEIEDSFDSIISKL